MRPDDAIAFGEKVLAMLDQGSFTATYKYAVLLALIDACLEGTDAQGNAPTVIHPQVLARRVVELYWPHTNWYGDVHGGEPIVLRQNSSGQAEVVSLIHRFRAAVEPAGHAPIARAAASHHSGYERLVRDVTWKLVQMPLPRLQRFGSSDERFLYGLDWDEGVSRRRFESGEISPELRLRPGAGEYLVRLAGLLRPLVQQQWATRVVHFNRSRMPALREQGDLESFLFGSQRIDLSPVRGDLADLQDRDCFYCREGLQPNFELDHFLPWARHPDNGVHNLVAAHRACNNRKRDFLAASVHVRAWGECFHRPGLSEALDEVAAVRRWPSHPVRTLSVARAIYLRLPQESRLWVLADEFIAPDRALLMMALGAAEPHQQAAEQPTPFSPRA